MDAILTNYKIEQATDLYQNDGLWKWSVWIEGPAADLDQIEKVRYTLHPTFPNPVREISDRHTKFRLEAEGRSEFTIYITLFLKNGSDVKLRHDLQFQQNVAAATTGTVPLTAPITRLTVYGQSQPITGAQDSDYFGLQLQQSILVSAAVRGEDNSIQMRLTDDHLVELVFEDNTTWLCTPDTLEELYPGQVTQQRGTEAGFQLPLSVTSERAERGLIQQIALKVVNLFTKKAAATGMQALAEDLEGKHLGKLRGLVKVSPIFELTPFNSGELQVKTPALLFIHGTNSSSAGSFGELVGTDLWGYITQTYNRNNILAFQHETLTKSPLQNAVELMKQLPEAAELHLITHSRGGLVGEILARCSDTGQTTTGFSEKEIAYLTKEGREADVKYIRELQEVYRQKKFRVSRFIRVACPTGGTTILSKRLDHFFNISLNLLGAATGMGVNPVYVAMKNLLSAVIDQKNDVNVLPGLEAMKPDSPFIVALNNQDTTIDRPVVAISGNCKAKVNFKALLILAEKLFFLENNDLVVNTSSMYAGSKRRTRLQYFFDEGTDVDHFHYFKNKKTNTAIQMALQQRDETLVTGFMEYSRGMLTENLQRQALLNLQGGEYATGEPTGKRPIVVLLPGIMGSCLSKDFESIWLNYWRMLKGGLLQLETTNDGITAPSIVRTSYQQLGETLSRDYDVVTFPFDWRLSTKAAAAKLEATIKKLLALHQPIKLVAHSMGGLVVRDLMVFYPETWNDLNNSPSFRLLFLGSPLMGSFRILNVLFGEDDIISKLSKLDLLHTKKQLLGMFSQFPGILALLPLTKDGMNDFASETIWASMAAAYGDSSWPIPKKDNGLKEFGIYRNTVTDKMPGLDFRNAVYIAGQFAHTPCGYRIDAHKNNRSELVLLSTAEGDQSVTWDPNIPASMISKDNVYYVNHSHGDLSNAPDMFTGIKEILEKGRTSLFSTRRPAVRAEKKVFRKPLVTDFDLSQEGVENTLLGLSGEEAPATSRLPLKVSVSHGDLKYAAHPVICGHFKRDSILYAEKRIDKLLAGQLEERNKLAIYPGEIGTSEVLLTYAEDGFPGAIVAGIGEQDKLTGFDLSTTIEQAIAKYLLIVNGRRKLNSDLIKDPIGISPLVIGCGFGGLSIETSVHSILLGIVNANAKMLALYGEKARLIEEVEFIEQYQDRALGCFYAIRRMSKDMAGALNIVPAEDIRECNGSRQKVNVDQGRDWWNRITIASQDNTNGAMQGLNFSITTGAAREEQKNLYMTGGIVDQLIESISVNNHWTKEKAATIFELLMPNDFKNRLKRQGNITWVLDKQTAGYPWELLQHKGEDVKPLCINAGMIRQMVTDNSRVNIQMVTSNTALVIGDPQLNGFLPQLPGALEEAKAVNEVLKAHQYDTLALFGEQQDTIIPALMSGSYKIIHLAGHGLFDADPAKPSGMVIGKDNFLTTMQLAQMSETPDLVFVNCCYQGKVDGTAEKYYQSRFKLAASIGTQLIENGVKAVIVAGWAVDDKAANVFAREFYSNMLKGKTFGEAVRQARETIYNLNPHINTWGAYQCYGNPFYRFRDESQVYEEKQYVITEQAQIDLINLESDMRTGDYSVDELLVSLKAISEETDKRKLRTPAITELEARIYKSLNKYELALAKYEQLMNSVDGGYSFSAIELYCNLRSKLLKERIDKKTEQADVLEKEFQQLNNSMEALILLSPTADRYSILGSSWKRRTALYLNNPKRLQFAIRQSANHYRMASNLKASAYPYTNWITLEALLVMAGLQKWGELPCAPETQTDEMPAPTLFRTGNGNAAATATKPTSLPLPTHSEIINELTGMQQYYTHRSRTLSFEDWVALSNLQFVEWVVKSTAAGDDSSLKILQASVVDSYLGVWKKVGATEDRLSEIQHLQLLIDALAALTTIKKEDEHFMVAQMREVMLRLQQQLN